MKTFSLKKSDIKKKWVLIDAKDAVLGRLAVISANILRGKNKPEYTPNQMKEKNKSDEMIKLAIKRMIPRGPLGRQQLSNCKIYRDENHKHEAQNPQIIDIESMNTKNKI